MSDLRKQKYVRQIYRRWVWRDDQDLHGREIYMAKFIGDGFGEMIKIYMGERFTWERDLHGQNNC